MNGVHRLNGRPSSYSYETSVPAGCLGRVANLFDLTSAVARNHRLLTDNPHRDGSPLSRSRSDISRLSSPIAEAADDQMTGSEMTRSKKPEGTPMKMLIAEEMSNELESRHSSPNVVAKLMGLDALPEQQLPDLVHHGRSNPRCHLRNSYSEVPAGCWHRDDSFFDRGVIPEMIQAKEQYNYKDIYEIWQSSPKTNCSRDGSPQKGRCNEDTNQKKMALIRQTFIDAKRLSTDENLRQTKEFKDAVEFLSSNQDLFLKVLQEPTSVVSHHLYGAQSIPSSPETKRITVLRPSKMVPSDKYPASGNRNDKQVRKSPPGNQASVRGNHLCGASPVAATWRVDESPTQPTRIVVLKPSLGRFQDVKAAVPSTPSSPRHLQRTDLFEEPGDDGTQEAREVAKEITEQMRENLAGHRRDETLLSSVLSNGYTGDGSSFNKSEAEFVGNLSDQEVMSPVSRHSWDYVNRYGSPYSCSSFGRASYSPESSVAREARKRLSERWAMMASNGATGDHMYVRRSASTLGEMLALSDVKKPEIYEEVDDPKGDKDLRSSASCLTSSTGGEIESPRSLLRSKSLPVSSTTTGQRLDVEALGPEARKINGLAKQTTKSSFRGKVTSLFFPRSSKKPSREQAERSLSQDQHLPNIAESSVPFRMPCSNSSNSVSEEIQSPDSQSVKGTLLAEMNDKSRQGLSSQQLVWSSFNPATSGTLSENQDQPSPISVLEPPFEEDARNTMGFSDAIIPNQLGKQMNFSLGKSNLIGKSPPIGSIARTLSWDEPCAQPATSDPLKSSFLSPPGGAEGEGWLFLVQSLLSAAGLENESQLRSNLTRWHSPDSPLDPLLREKYIDLTSKEPLHASKRRQLRSNRLLVFDSVNAALVDITGMGSSYSSTWVHERKPGPTPTGDDLADRVWVRMKEWLWSGGWNEEGEGEDGGDDNSLAAERVVRKELVGRGWTDEVRLEIDFIGKEVEGKLLEELVEESIGVLTGKVW